MLARMDQACPTWRRECRLAAAVCVVALFVGGRAAAQRAVPEAANSHPGGGPIRHGQQHQPSRTETQQRLRDAGVGRDRTRSEAELRDLNDLSRRLLPPGASLPAPGVANGTTADR